MAPSHGPILQAPQEAAEQPPSGWSPGSAPGPEGRGPVMLFIFPGELGEGGLHPHALPPCLP